MIVYDAAFCGGTSRRTVSILGVTTSPSIVQATASGSPVGKKFGLAGNLSVSSMDTQVPPGRCHPLVVVPVFATSRTFPWHRT